MTKLLSVFKGLGKLLFSGNTTLLFSKHTQDFIPYKEIRYGNTKKTFPEVLWFSESHKNKLFWI